MSASTSHASQLGLAALSRQLAEQQGCLLALTGKLQGVQAGFGDVSLQRRRQTNRAPKSRKVEAVFGI